MTMIAAAARIAMPRVASPKPRLPAALRSINGIGEVSGNSDKNFTSGASGIDMNIVTAYSGPNSKIITTPKKLLASLAVGTAAPIATSRPVNSMKLPANAKKPMAIRCGSTGRLLRSTDGSLSWS
ncbi:hypothetical protein G1ANC_00547 [Candidatus Nanosynsacchari sp. TM7_ANC_38.39_G1_1]|nr:hypothetical protein G1ANC_00547 [Candidatus Nanosynsacchari sp. TM7_ANC_38.39_G1_1]